MQGLAYRPTAPILTGRGLVMGPRKRILSIGRDLCSFSCIDQRDQTSRSARRREAELEGLRIAIAQDAGCYIVLWKDSAAIWTWDDAAVAAELSRAERDDLLQATRVPEPLMLAPEIVSEGPNLTTCLVGVEGQFWRDGELIGSRWWRERPSDQEWLVFAESSGVSGASRAPEPVVRAPLSQPWKVNEYRPQHETPVDRRVVFWGAAAASALTLAGLTYAIGVEYTYARLAASVAALEISTAPVREANRRVLSANAEYRRITAPLSGMDGLDITTAIATIGARSNIRVLGLELRNDRIYVACRRTDAAAVDAFLRLLDENDRFENARLGETATNNPTEIQLEADLVIAPVMAP